MGLARVRRLITSRRLGWVLAFALWLPMAQWAAATHTLLHLHASVAEDGEQPAHLPESCESCVVAATLLAAAPGVAPGPRLPPPAPAAQPPRQRAVLPPRPERTAYDSRAPPYLHA
jgi:hypothetical protein